MNNLENHMVLPGPCTGDPNDPSTPEARAETCDRCGEEKPTKNCGLAGQICQDCLDRYQRKQWGDELRAAKPGDVIVRVDKDRFRYVLVVRAIHHTHISGDSALATPDGVIYSLSLNHAVACFDVPLDTADLQVVRL